METGFVIFIWGFIFVALIYLVVRRINISEQEDFEKRDD